MLEYASQFGSSPTEGEEYAPLWSDTVDSSYLVLGANQCPQTGLVTNWFIPNEANPSTGGSVGSSCAYSGTPPAEFGAEACRSPWRITLDYLWYPNASMNTYGSIDFTRRIASGITSKLQLATSSCHSVNCNSELKLDILENCFVKSVLEPWTDLLWANIYSTNGSPGQY